MNNRFSVYLSMLCLGVTTFAGTFIGTQGLAEQENLIASGNRSLTNLEAGQLVIKRHRQLLLNPVPASFDQGKKEEADEKNTKAWIASLDANGVWPDINYSVSEPGLWPAAFHLDRLTAMSRSFVDPTQPLHHDSALKQAIMMGLDHWISNPYKSNNWWWNQIGVPQKMRDIILLLDQQLEGERRQGALKIMGQCNQHPTGGLGANTLWFVALAVEYGILTENSDLVQRGAQLLAGEIRMTTGEGIQSDYSFYQHGERLQQFHYGRSFLQSASQMAWLLRDTPWAISPEAAGLLADYVLNGSRWMCRGIYTVPPTLDRAVSRPDTLSFADMRLSVRQLQDLLPQRYSELQAVWESQEKGTASITGAKYFPRTDFFTFHRPSFSFFAKMTSTRTLLAESINNENLKRDFQSCGDHYLIRDGAEYLKLPPVWDWNQLPAIPFGADAGKPIRKRFAGGVTDGISGVAAMDYASGTPGKEQLSCRKFWACHGDIIVFLIGDLTAAKCRQPVSTALDQCLLRTPVMIAAENGAPQLLSSGEERELKPKWIYHAGFAYAPLGDLPVSIHCAPRQGSWQSINLGQSADPLTVPVFLPILNHGVAPVAQNSGCVIAAATMEQVSAIFAKPSWTILRNDGRAQAVEFSDGTVMAAFYAATQVTLSNQTTLSADRPCVVLKRLDHVSASDPDFVGGDLKLEFSLAAPLNLKLPADGTSRSGLLLTLSACESGEGSRRKSDLSFVEMSFYD